MILGYGEFIQSILIYSLTHVYEKFSQCDDFLNDLYVK